MKLFLFLFPSQSLIEGHIECDIRLPYLYEEPMEQLNCLVESRYRQNGFEVYWVLRSTDTFSERIVSSPSDQYITIGQKIDPECILAQLPKGVSKIILSGYHVLSCVDKVGRALYESGYDVLVDEHLTEWYFSLLTLGHPIPARFDPEEYAESLRRARDEEHLAFLRRQRARTPWFVQP